MPKIDWKHEDAGGKAALRVTAKGAKAARLWVAQSATRDFRPATWKEVAIDNFKDGVAYAEVEMPTKGYTAFFGEMDFTIDGVTHQLSTQVRVLEAKK
jgi:PhoPQ-activated pathogenicity-related protein